ncbi:hypothetical protein MLD38_030460 [Melastoma candidum]|uniref:Uncharacterized protein n=1 Tax=Melastoma candidum TaxID=119954 RepID=A0ACB9MNT9_9MYRT|nr:hypothetical protein MLD38_030460 [Melastoma candidum]
MMKSLSPRLLRALSLDTCGPVHGHHPPGRRSQLSDSDDCRPSPSLVLLPAHITSHSIKDRLPYVKYEEFLRKKAGEVDLGGAKERGVCIVCMDGFDERDEVREQGNCGHVCHKDCLDAWIDQDHDVCPLCRARLLPSDEDKRDAEDGGGYDPWRAERMIYLFGEDCCF